jgi:hypothetical protein
VPNSGMDQNRLNDFLAASVGYSANVSSPFTAVLATPFSASSSQLGHIRVITTTTPSTSTSNGSELAGGSYVQGTGIQYTTGSAGQFSTPVFGSGPGGSGESSTGNNAQLSQTGMPAANIGGTEIWDSKGTAPTYATSNRWWWGQLSTPVSTNNGDTLVFNANAIIAALFGPGLT